MKEMLKITISLVITFVVAGIIMAVVFANTAPIMAKAMEREKKEALTKLMPEADNIAEAGKWEPVGKHGEYYEAKKGGATIGYLASTFGKGYSSYISLLVSTDLELKVRQISILGHGETPGLGDEIEKDYFKKKYEGKSLEQLEVVKVEGTDKILAISGATISSRAVTRGVKDAVAFLKDKYQGGPDKGTNGGAKNEHQ